MSEQRYLVTARKYRPALFGELVAQEHVTETLKNALRLDRLAHAYLFSGPRGVGKTTAARILAKAINCETPLKGRADEAEPCRTCASCRAFEEGRSLGIFEIDAASNNKVDDIRELRETVRIPPQGSRKKVYIIDEVHMLSNAAFNALLKTLEEPPPHVLFIFATTEPHKVLPTILSRCQRFDFRRIPVPTITDRLREICAEEDITADEASLMLLARKGDGALRDALSAFDQAVSLCGTRLQYAELAQALGVVDVDLFFRLTGHVQEKSSAGMLRLVDEVVRSGHDLNEFLAGLAEHLRNLLVARTMEDRTLIEAAEATRARYAEAAAAFSEADLLRLLLIAGAAEEDVKNSAQPRLKLEMALLKMAALTRAADLQAALQKLDRLEHLAREGNLPAEVPTPVSSPEKTAPPTKSTPSANDHPATTPKQEPPKQEPPKQTTAAEPKARYEAAAPEAKEIDAEEEDEAPAPPEATAAAPPERPASSPPKPTDVDEEADDDRDGSAPTPDTPPPAEQNASPEKEAPPRRPQTGYASLFGPPALQKQEPPPPSSGDGASSGDSASSGEAPTSQLSPAAVAVAPAATGTVEKLIALWPQFAGDVREARRDVGTCLQHARPLHLDAGTLTIAVPDGFHKSVLGDQERLLARCLPGALDTLPERFRFVVTSDAAESAAAAEAKPLSPREHLQQLREDHPVVRALFDAFGGEPVF